MTRHISIENIRIGNRVPTKYFIASGCGESDTGYHPGAFDIALEQAGICDYNLVPYSSILPRRVEKVDVPLNYEHGAVLECIQAVAGEDSHEIKGGKLITAGLIFAKFYKNNTIKPEELGGLVAEFHDEKPDISSVLRYGGASTNITGAKKIAEMYLVENIKEMFERRKQMLEKRHSTKGLHLEVIPPVIESFVTDKKYGCAQVVMGFTEFRVPLFG